MRTKDDVLSIWNDYINEYKNIQATIGELLGKQYPLPFNELWKVFGDVDDDLICYGYSDWVRMKRGQLFTIADRNGLYPYIRDDHYELTLSELTQGVSLDEFIVAMGLWCIGGKLESYLPKSVSVDKINFEEILNEKFTIDYYNYLYASIADGINRLHYRFKAEAIEKTVAECNKLLEDIVGNCAKYLEADYHQKYNKAIKLLRELYGNSQDTSKLDEIFTLLGEGEFSRWYYSGIYGHGMPITGIVKLIKVLEQQAQQD